MINIIQKWLTREVKIAKWQLNFFGTMMFTAGAVFGVYFLANRYLLPMIWASDLSTTWTFDVAGDFVVSDANLIEVENGSARLKVRNYSGDANTSLLLHLDDVSGNPVDSSGHAHTMTASGLTYGTGKLSGGASFDGATSKIVADDSDALSPTSALTTEAWIKLASALSAGSTPGKQPILDKGNYQFYIDNESGKLTFEMAPSNADNWSQVGGPDLLNANSAQLGGSWDLNSKPQVQSMVVSGSDVYVGLGNGIADAEVWKCTSCDTSPAWTRIGGNGVNGSWADGQYEEAIAMAISGSNLYVGLGNTVNESEVWRWNGSAWAKVGGDGVNSSWNNSYEIVNSMVVDGTTLYVGLGNSAGDAEVWRCTTCDSSPTWGGALIGGDAVSSSWANNTYEAVTKMTIVGSNLVVGLSSTAGDGEVWSTNISTISWTKRGGDGTATGGQSWGSTYEEVRALASSGNYLFVGLGNTPAGEAEVWRCDLSATCTATAGWTQVGGDGVGSSFNTNYERVWDLLVSGTTVYSAIGDTAGDAEVWKCTTCTGTPAWTQVGGDGNNTPPQSWNNTFTNAQTLSMIGNYLFVGVSNLSSAAGSEVWRCDVSGTCSATAGWTRVAGSHLNKSWGYYNRQSVESLTTHNGKMYAGTGNATAGNAQVWEYDGTSWTMIGGQAINSSWAYGTYESVLSMISFDGDLVVGLGTTANDAEVWKWNGTTWSQIGGDSSGTGGQSWTTGYEAVYSMSVYGGNLYVGLGNSANDAEVWKCTSGCTMTTGWTKVGGDSINSGWTTNYETVNSLVTHDGNLYAGLGASAGDAEVWKWNGSAWAKVGGDASGTSGQSWVTAVYEQVDSMISFGGELYVGLGLTAGEAEVWKCTGTCTATTGWTQVGGDALNTSWADSTYERVRSMNVFNGELYAGLGLSTGDGEVWRMDSASGNWTKVGGDALNSGWTNVMESVPALAVYKGKLYAATGDTANNDATVWAYGGNVRAQSTTNSWDTNWHHVATSFDGSHVRIYVDGVAEATVSAEMTLLNATTKLVVGAEWGSDRAGMGVDYLNGYLDELRISNTARSNFVTAPYATEPQTVRPSTASYTTQVKSWDGWSANETLSGGTVNYRVSIDGGSTWKYYNSGWVTSSSLSQVNTEQEINDNLATLNVGSGGFLWQAVLSGDGNQAVSVEDTTLVATSDAVAPEPPSTTTALNENGGLTNLVSNNWYGHSSPYFSWSGATDTGSGVSGYYVYFGTDETAVPQTAGSFQTNSNYAASGLVSGNRYYLRIQSKDNASNVSSTYAAFVYNYDASNPVNPATVSVSPAGYAPTNYFTFSWPAGSDLSSGIAGYQYKTGTASGSLSNWSEVTTSTSVIIDKAAYTEGENVFYLRTVDVAGNVSATPAQVNYYFAGSGPSEPRFLGVSPQTSVTNSFAFSWQVPTTYSGEASALTYCYTVNTLPSASSCNYTSAGATSLSAQAFATQVGLNTFYVVAKNPAITGGSINYGSYASVTFTANTSAPGIPNNADIADVSVKSTSSWKLALSWERPVDVGSGVSSYEIYRSTDGAEYEEVASTTGIAYVDTGLLQQEYSYKVRACDNVNNCGAFSTPVSMEPTGKYTEPASLSSGPVVTSITTKKATISWSTDRASDSKVQYGESSGSYYTEEPSNSTQTTDHKIVMTNLTSGKTYYYKAKWTDEDGNTGSSEEKTFTTEPAPTVSDPKLKTAGLTSATLEYTVKGASKVKIYYGKTPAFGGVKEVSTSTSETTYVTALEELEDGTKYFYKINLLDSEGFEYDGSILTFETLPRPKISKVTIQQVTGTAQPTVLVSWETNTETSSIVTYYPTSEPGKARDEVNVAMVKGVHRIVIRGLLPETPYSLVVRGRDKAGNEASSDIQRITTATDTRPALISDLSVEGSTSLVQGGNGMAVAQLVVSWTTDEPTTSQVEFGEGTGAVYSQKTQEDSALTYNHQVVISNLTPAKVYHLRAVAKDKANNVALSSDSVTITPKATDSALNLVVTNLQETFGFLSNLNIQ